MRCTQMEVKDECAQAKKVLPRRAVRSPGRMFWVQPYVDKGSRGQCGPMCVLESSLVHEL